MNYLGYSWLEEGENLNEAVDLLKKSVSISPNGANIDSLGWGYYKLGDYEKAEILLEEAAKLMPSNIEILGHLAKVYKAQGKNLKAKHTINNIEKLEE